MFRFIYALGPSEMLDPGSLQVDEFDGFEAPGPADHGVTPVGRRATDLATARTWLDSGLEYAVLKPDVPWRLLTHDLDRTLTHDCGLLMIEPWADCPTVRALWQFSETVTSRQVRLAWSQSYGESTAQRPSEVIPVLNLKLGLVRLRDSEASAVEIIKRLAGIGFEGHVVADPEPSPDRLNAGRRIVEIAKDILQPRKPAARK